MPGRPMKDATAMFTRELSHSKNIYHRNTSRESSPDMMKVQASTIRMANPDVGGRKKDANRAIHARPGTK